MAEAPISGGGDIGGGASPEGASPAAELRFEGFGGAAPGFLHGRADPRVSSLAGSGAKYKAMSPAQLPITRSPCLTIPPGFSPSSLLESPVLLTNIKAEPSPTTGTFSMFAVAASKAFASGLLPSPRDTSGDNSACGNGTFGDFEFKPHIRASLNSGLSSLGSLNCVGQKQQEHAPSVQFQNRNQTHALESVELVNAENTVICSHAFTSLPVAPDLHSVPIPLKTIAPTNHTDDDLQPSKGVENDIQALQSDNNESVSLTVTDKSSEDGYNWRKYGQKHVKGSEFPRSYYKCTHPNCQMKKQLERTHDGQITEIVYKGRHDHPKPQPSRRLTGTYMSGQAEDKPDDFYPIISAADKSLSAHENVNHHIDPNGTQDLSPLSTNDDDAEAGVGQSNHVDDDDDDDPESKRRKKDATCVDATSLGKINREPRVVVQTISEVDILDDGYRWRKYGQKVVKGNPNPRSYYKCTSTGCPVRKHVERASHDPKAVITTYEGKHNHDVPAARTTGHDTSGQMNMDGANTLNNHLSVALSGMLRTCGTTRIPNCYAKPVESDTISLNLGVGVTRNQGSTASEEQQAPQTGHNYQVHLPGSGFSKGIVQAVPMMSVSAVYGSSSSSIYGSREDKREGFSFGTQLANRSPNRYYSNAGNVVMGP